MLKIAILKLTPHTTTTGNVVKDEIDIAGDMIAKLNWRMASIYMGKYKPL